MDATTPDGAAQQEPRYGYHRANQWPGEIPPLTHAEIVKAWRILWKVFGKVDRGKSRPRIRRVWVPTKAPFNTLHRGWRRFVHDISHRIHSRQHPGKRDHDYRHAWLEGEMVKYVIEHGWLEGKLKPKEKAKPTAQEVKDNRYQRVIDGIARWEKKWQRAENALCKLRRKKAYYERRLVA